MKPSNMNIKSLDTIIEEGWASNSLPSETLHKVIDAGYFFISLRYVMQKYDQLDKSHNKMSKSTEDLKEMQTMNIDDILVSIRNDINKLIAKNEQLRTALKDLMVIIEEDELIPGHVSCMKQAKNAIKD